MRRGAAVSKVAVVLVACAGAAALAIWLASSNPLTASLIPLLVLAAVARLTQPRWLAPGPFFAAYWLLAAALPVLLLPGAFVTDRALFYVAGAVAVFMLGASAASARGSSPGDIESPRGMPVLTGRGARNLRLLPKIGAAAGLFATALALQSGGIDLRAIATLGGLLDTGNALAVARYAGEGGQSPLITVLLALTYAAALGAPFTLLEAEPRRWRLILVLAPFLAALAYSAVTTARLSLLIAAALTISGYLAARLLRDGEMPTLSGRNLVRGGLAAAAVGVLFVAIAFIRVGRLDPSIVPVIREKLSVYAFGYMPGFAQWLDRYVLDPSPLGWGTGSVAGVEFLTGLDRDATRAYGEFVQIDLAGSTTNIHTALRSLLLDFGVPGTVLFLVAAGFLMDRAYRAVKQRPSAGMAAALGAAYAVVILSNTMMITTFTNVVAGLAVGWWWVHQSFAIVPTREPIKVAREHSPRWATPSPSYTREVSSRPAVPPTTGTVTQLTKAE